MRKLVKFCNKQEDDLVIFQEKLDDESWYIKFMLGDSQVQVCEHKNKERKAEFWVEKQNI